MACASRFLVALGLTVPACTNETADAVATAPGRAKVLDSASLRYDVRQLPSSLQGYDGFYPVGLTPDRAVILDAFGCPPDSWDCWEEVVKADLDGGDVVIAERFRAYDVNRNGDVGGCFLDYVYDSRPYGQAAIIHRDGSVRRLPRRPGEQACVVRLSDGETALVLSIPEGSYPDGSSDEYWYVDLAGETFPVPPELGVEAGDINDRGELPITLFPFRPAERVPFRFDAQGQTLTPLAPANRENNYRARAINQRGDVLGDSFVDASQTRIGFWNEANEFNTVLDTDSLPTSDTLAWNENGLIVASVSDDRRTYVIPEPGIRIDVASLVDDCNVPDGLGTFRINENGDFLAIRSPDGAVYAFLRRE